ncbi:CpaF family protein [Alkalicoccobacillus plakortidis]|uniref:CpaF family protein n=1 Tax=Alkalicoccobacillus plakortidis TaxID=444060 RepID=A0ABT0XMJ6_9BACI|nr:CpaF family protein [Alkalicoccobacillus plakortidis]MCM2677132.1 CpaF family protein [Alkalicoccobacillus plakortidis]
MVDDKVIRELISRLRETLDLMHSIPNDKLMEHVENAVFEYAQEHSLKSAEMKWLVDRIYHSFRGYDVLQPLIEDKSITEIMVNSHKEVFIERNGKVSQMEVEFESQQKLEDIIQAIVSKVDRVVNESSPIVDARLQDGSRVNVVLPPIALKGPVITIRKFPERPLMIEDLIAYEAITQEAADFLNNLVKAKYNIFIGGGTGSGKTTFLNVLSNFIPPNERIITLEDSAELQIHKIPNLVSLETRNANTEGKGEISIRELIKTSLRMRPNRIIVGEVRGAEALDMLQAMNTGHDGSLSTGHANSTTDMLSRLETMVLSGANLPVEVIRKQISSAIEIMVHLSRLRDHSRKVVSISELLDLENGEIQVNPLFEFVEEEEGPKGEVIGRLKPTGNKLQSVAKLKQAGIYEETIKVGETN